MMGRVSALLGCLVMLCAVPGFAQENAAMPTDARYHIRTLDDHFEWPGYQTKGDWLARAKYCRDHILISCGLWPMPQRCALNAQIFGRLERDGYTVEKAYFESYPGFFVTGNLYRPLGKPGPFPGVISPHGHWGRGRLANEEQGSVPGRAINLARQGCVVFSYDMIGYNDSRQVDHRFGGQREELWSISPMGLQLWDSIRAIDFLESLPDVDDARIGCTGASGGGTQTFMVTATDIRIWAAAPVNMVSAYMQGGCKCENAPNLRTDMYNVEIAAMAAPRPYLMVSATGDWTSHTLEEEYPDVRSVYELYDAADRVKAVRFDAPHNYNQDSREAMYAWFGRWLLNDPNEEHFTERPFPIERDEDLLVWAGRELPEGAVTQDQLIGNLIALSEAQLERLKPKDAEGLKEFRSVRGTSLQHALGVSVPVVRRVTAEKVGETTERGRRHEELILGREEVGDKVPALFIAPSDAGRKCRATLIIHPAGAASSLDSAAVRSVVDAVASGRRCALLVDCFNTGQSQPPNGWAEALQKTNHWTTYNRTEAANRVQDIVSGVEYLRSRPQVSRVEVLGLEEAGLWVLLAAALEPNLKTVVVDAAEFDNSSDEQFVQKLFVPGLRRAGDLHTAGALICPRRLLIHNTGDAFDAGFTQDVYKAAGASGKLKVLREQATPEQIAAWLRAS